MTHPFISRRPVVLLLLLTVLIVTPTGLVSAHDSTAGGMGRWSGGTGVGFLGGTPDGVEFALNGHLNYFISEEISIGPLVQYAGAGDDFLFGLTAQGKYWWAIPGTNNQTKLVLQGGIGFVRAGVREPEIGFGDTFSSFLIPLGIGVDHAVNEQVSVTADFMLNITSLGREFRVAGREADFHTNVMPGLYFGVRF
ncbi:MAG: outer membrane beta-barrel protein [Nitrospira sp.]|nr:outer membrane beta-barrel protein [Nitrospira sp.]